MWRVFQRWKLLYLPFIAAIVLGWFGRSAWDSHELQSARAEGGAYKAANDGLRDQVLRLQTQTPSPSVPTPAPAVAEQALDPVSPTVSPVIPRHAARSVPKNNVAPPVVQAAASVAPVMPTGPVVTQDATYCPAGYIVLHKVEGSGSAEGMKIGCGARVCVVDANMHDNKIRNYEVEGCPKN
jgi:hypothetical protein